MTSDADGGFDCPLLYPGIVGDAHWCGPSELREEQRRVVTDGEEAWKEEGDI